MVISRVRHDPAMPRKERFSIAPLGEYYRDLLELDSWITGRTASLQANSLLSAKLQEREKLIEERLEKLAKKRGITAEQLRVQILKGDAEALAPGDVPETDDDEE